MWTWKLVKKNLNNFFSIYTVQNKLNFHQNLISYVDIHLHQRWYKVNHLTLFFCSHPLETVSDKCFMLGDTCQTQIHKCKTIFFIIWIMKYHDSFKIWNILIWHEIHWTQWEVWWERTLFFHSTSGRKLYIHITAGYVK